MLTIFGSQKNNARSGYCDGISRRGMLKIGALGVGAFGLNQADLLRAAAAGKTQMNHKSVINIFLGGGPPHQDMWEIKTEAPKNIRGPFKPIATNVPGIQIGECFPKIAQSMDKAAVLRAVVGCEGRHDSFQCMTGFRHAELRSIAGCPPIDRIPP